MAVKCPKCQAENRKGVKFSEDCRGKLESSCPSCGRPRVSVTGIPEAAEDVPRNPRAG